MMEVVHYGYSFILQYAADFDELKAPNGKELEPSDRVALFFAKTLISAVDKEDAIPFFLLTGGFQNIIMVSFEERFVYTLTVDPTCKSVILYCTPTPLHVCSIANAPLCINTSLVLHSNVLL